MQTSNWFALPRCGTTAISCGPSTVTAYGDGHVSGSVTGRVDPGCAFLLGRHAGAGHSRRTAGRPV